MVERFGESAADVIPLTQVLADYLATARLAHRLGATSRRRRLCIVSIEDRRDGREHILETCEDLEAWLESFKQGRLLQPLTSQVPSDVGRDHLVQDLGWGRSSGSGGR